MTLPDITWIIRFTHTSGETEEVEHTAESAAREHFACFGIEDADLYERVTLVEYDWRTRSQRLLATLELPA